MILSGRGNKECPPIPAPTHRPCRLCGLRVSAVQVHRLQGLQSPAQPLLEAGEGALHLLLVGGLACDPLANAADGFQQSATEGKGVLSNSRGKGGS